MPAGVLTSPTFWTSISSFQRRIWEHFAFSITLALAGAFLIGLIPLWGTARKIIKNKSWDQRRDESVLALFTSLAGGGVLFAINYGLFLLKIRMGDAFHIAFVFLIVAVLIAGSVYLYRKKD